MLRRLATALVLTCALAAPATGQLDDNFTVRDNPILRHDGLIATCAANFGAASLERTVAQLTLSDSAGAGFDPAFIERFVADFLSTSCAQYDCTRPAVQTFLCAQLTSYALVPF